MGRDRRRAREARRLGALGLLAATVLPFWAWWPVIADIARAHEHGMRGILGWVPWALMLGGIAFLVPVMLSVGRRADSRLYPRARNALFGWGISLYLLGLALASQVARLHAGALAP